MPPKNKYTDPKLRDEVKEEVQQGEKGGAPGQWSARKAQFMASEYKKRGGSYNTDKKDQDESQKHLSKWTEEEWQTKEGSGNAKQTETEKKETEEKKLDESKEGKQFVQNNGRGKSARQKANREKDEDFEKRKAIERAAKKPKRVKEEDPQNTKASENKGEEGHDQDQKNAEPANAANTGQKRKAKNTNDETTSSKKVKTKSSESKKSSKTIGSKHDPSSAPAEQASADRLPEKGQTVHWKALPGWVEGEVVEVVYDNTEVEGKSVKAKKDDPRIVMRSKNGKIAVHKPSAVYFD